MSITTANLSLYDSRNYRSVPVAVSLGRWRRYLLFYPLHVLRCWHHEYAIAPSKIIGIPAMSRFTDPCRKILTQIPIALLPILTAVPRPAVSSLEAYQTPAR